MRRFLMGLITGGVLSAAALAVLSQMTLNGRSGDMDAKTSAVDTDASSGLSSGAIPSGTEVEPATSAASADDAVAQTDADLEVVTEDQPIAETSEAMGEDEDTAAEGAAIEGSGTEDTATEGSATNDAGTDEAATDEAATATETDETTQPDETVAEAEPEPEPEVDPNADAPVPDVSQSLATVPQQDEAILPAPTVVDRDTGETIDVTASLRSTKTTVPDAPTPEGQVQVSTTPAARPVVQPQETPEAQDGGTDSGTDTGGGAAMQQPVETTELALSPSIGTKGSDLKSLAPAIKINRLPTLNNAAEPDVDAKDMAEPASAPDPSSLPVLQRFAAAFENPEAKPLMSIVLMDQGATLDGSEVGVEALSQFPHPITFAIDSRLPDAAARMKKYRDAGFEVLAMVDMPSGFTAQDTEVSMGVILSDLPEITGVLEGVDTGLQSDRAVSRQIAAILAQTGHGLITQDKGLNTGLQFAQRAGVPSREVYRDFDSKDQSAVVIRRFLDQAAFKAGQENGIVMLGRVRPETISALLLWGLQERAKRVAIAPASALMMDR